MLIDKQQGCSSCRMIGPDEHIVKPHCGTERRASRRPERRHFRRRNDVARARSSRPCRRGYSLRARSVARLGRLVPTTHHVHDEFSDARHFLGRAANAVEYWSIAFIVLVQLNYAIAPRIRRS